METYTATISAKYDCGDLASQNFYYSPFSNNVMVAVYNPTTSTYNYNPSSTVAYTVGDPEFYVLSQMIYTSSTKHSFSCFVQYEFSCPAGDSSCAISSDVLELGVTNSTLADLTERI